MSIETSGDREERSEAVPGATAAVVADVPAEAQRAGGWSPRELLRGDLGQLPVFIGLVVIALYFQVRSNGFFFYPENLSGLADQVVSIMMIGVAALLVLLIGEIDLSLVAVAYFTGAVTGVLSVHQHWAAIPAILAGIVVGAVIGMINGFFIAVLRMPSFIVTVAGLIFYQGALEHILLPQTTLQIIDPTIDGIYFYRMPFPWEYILAGVPLVIYIAFVLRGRIARQRAGLPVQSNIRLALQIVLPVAVAGLLIFVFDNYQGVQLRTVITLAVIVPIWLIISKTGFGRHMYAVGGSAEAARRAGINVVGLRIAVFSLASTLAAVGGLLIITRANVAPTLIDQGLLLNAIAAAVIGGVSLFGGRGSLWGVVLGALIVSSLLNGLALLNIGPDVVEMIEGAVLIVAVLIDALARRRSVTGYR